MTDEFILGEVSRTMALLICRVRQKNANSQEKGLGTPDSGTEAPPRPMTSSAQPFEFETRCES